MSKKIINKNYTIPIFTGSQIGLIVKLFNSPTKEGKSHLSPDYQKKKSHLSPTKEGKSHLKTSNTSLCWTLIHLLFNMQNIEIFFYKKDDLFII